MVAEAIQDPEDEVLSSAGTDQLLGRGSEGGEEVFENLSSLDVSLERLTRAVDNMEIFSDFEVSSHSNNAAHKRKTRIQGLSEESLILGMVDLEGVLVNEGNNNSFELQAALRSNQPSKTTLILQKQKLLTEKLLAEGITLGKLDLLDEVIIDRALKAIHEVKSKNLNLLDDGVTERLLSCI